MAQKVDQPDSLAKLHGDTYVMQMDFINTQIVEIEKPSSEYALLRFKGERAMEGEPGQFVMIRGAWRTDPILPRAFSLVEVGTSGAVLVREVGPGTSLLCNMTPGDSLSVLGPLGNSYAAPQEGARPVLVAEGVGVAPLVFLAEKLAREGRSPLFLYGARGADDLPLRERIAGVCELTITTEDGSVGEKGLVTAPLERFLRGGDPANVYSCGPHPMLEAVFGVSRNAGASCQVALESPMACGMGTCKGCAVVAPDGSFKYVCSDGPCFEAASIFGGAP